VSRRGKIGFRNETGRVDSGRGDSSRWPNWSDGGCPKKKLEDNILERVWEEDEQKQAGENGTAAKPTGAGAFAGSRSGGETQETEERE
jgi:hypothetical protein